MFPSDSSFTDQKAQVPSQNPPNFTVRQGLFPENRPDVMPTPQENPMNAQPVTPGLNQTVSQVVDMEIAGMVMSRMDLSKTWRRNWRLTWDKCWQHMKGQYDTANKAAWQSRTFMPLTSKVVEVIASNLHSAILGPEMPIEYQTKRADMDQLIRSTNEIIQGDFDKCKAKVHLTDHIRDLCVMGTSVGEVGYVKEWETVMVKQQQSPQDDMLRSMGLNPGGFLPKQMLVKDYATITNKNLYDIYPQPRISDFSKDHWVIEKSTITNRELKIGSMEKDAYYKFDNVTDDLLQGSGMQRVDQDPEKQTWRFTLQDYNQYTHYLDPDREHELATYYGQIPLWYLKPELRNDPGHQYDSLPGCIKVVDGQYVIWKRISPWRDAEPPYFKSNYIRLSNQFYGIGVAELVMGLQIEKNEIRNSRMDNINLAMNKIIAVIKEMVPPGEHKRLVSEPGAIWLFKGVDDVRKAVQQVEMGDMTKDSWVASQEVDREAEEVTAANKTTQSNGGSDGASGGNTFRGQMLNVQQATGRWMLYARMLEWMGLIPAMKKFYQRIYQFKELKDCQETLGGERGAQFQLILPEDLEKMAKLVPLGVMTMENRGVKLAQMAQFQQQWMGQPWFKALEFARKEYVEMGNQEPDQVLFSDEEMKQFNQAKQMLMNSMPGMTGGMPPSNGGIVGPNGQPVQSGQSGNSPTGQPVAGNVPGPTQGMPRPSMPARGPGGSPMDLNGRPVG